MVRDTTLYQDNLSAMLLENNDKGSSSKRTRHIQIRIFFISDMKNDKQLKIEHEPTGTMVGDFLRSLSKELHSVPSVIEF